MCPPNRDVKKPWVDLKNVLRKENGEVAETPKVVCSRTGKETCGLNCQVCQEGKESTSFQVLPVSSSSFDDRQRWPFFRLFQEWRFPYPFDVDNTIEVIIATPPAFVQKESLRNLLRPSCQERRPTWLKSFFSKHVKARELKESFPCII